MVGLALGGCLGGDGFFGDDDAGAGGYGGGDELEILCEAGCELVDDCDLCVTGDGGDCLSVDDCAVDCYQRDLDAQARCLGDLLVCDAEAIDVCLSLDDEDDVCAQACLALDDCELCQSEGGQCLSVAECVLACHDEEQTAEAQCLVAVAACDQDAFDACLSLGDDGCSSACGVIDGCGLSVRGADGEPLDIPECAEQCRAREDSERFAGCINAVEDCGQAAIDACFEPSEP